ncbi:hypothetical protein C8F01DRAFT_1345908 [Mycena amicta]|nr:hypothetical protein C8F01DRAFT_1345908 [Mycena amicta]
MKRQRHIKILCASDEGSLNDVQSVRLGPMAQAERSSRTRQAHQAELLGMTRLQRRRLTTTDPPNMDDDPAHWVNIDNVLDGTESLELSHAGGELSAMEDDIAEAVFHRPRHIDYRTRRDRTQRMVDGFATQQVPMLQAYMEWCAIEEDVREASRWADAEDGDLTTFNVVGLSAAYRVSIVLDKTNGLCASLLARGFVPCSPISPTATIAIEALEFFRLSHARCARFVIQAFVKTLCDIHKVPYRPHLRAQFSVAYDVYLELRRRAEKSVLGALGRDSMAWRMKNDCAACGYKLEGEESLLYDRLLTIDGNNSLKRVDGNLVASQRMDNRDGGDTYFLTRAKVDTWARQQIAAVIPEVANPCEERWRNMSEEITSKMWSIFDQTGIFLCLCRHGFAVVVVEMIKSGELFKYPLAVVEAILEHFGPNTALGFDTGCNLEITIAKSELGNKAQHLGLRCLVGSFHGHAHNRWCQLGHLASYLEGMGLEDFEGCERCFSRSNSLSNSCRYATPFHWKQEIATYFKQTDNAETYANLSNFLCNNYKQALGLLATEQDLRDAMELQGIASADEFAEALQQEREFLARLKASSKSKEETGSMEYLRKLRQLDASNDKLRALRREKRSLAAPDLQQEGDVPLAVQVQIYRERRSIYNAVHLQRFQDLARKHGAAFTGNLRPGVAVGVDSAEMEDEPNVGDVRPVDMEDGVTPEEREEIEEEDDLAEASGLAYEISILGIDDGERGNLANHIDK